MFLINFTNDSFCIFILLLLSLLHCNFLTFNITLDVDAIINTPIDTPYLSGYDSDSSLEDEDTTFSSILPMRIPPLDILAVSVPLHSQIVVPRNPINEFGNYIINNLSVYVVINSSLIY